jgi:hypothetical protein
VRSAATSGAGNAFTRHAHCLLDCGIADLADTGADGAGIFWRRRLHEQSVTVEIKRERILADNETAPFALRDPRVAVLDACDNTRHLDEDLWRRE